MPDKIEFNATIKLTMNAVKLAVADMIERDHGVVIPSDRIVFTYNGEYDSIEVSGVKVELTIDELVKMVRKDA